MRWHCFQIYYHAEDKDRLILEAIRPMARRLGGQVDSLYYLRHWLRGPHVRLYVRCSPALLGTLVRPTVEELTARFLAERPSTARLDPQEHLPMHRRLAELESVSGDLLPWHRDNSLHLTTEAEPAPAEATSARLLADFYSDSTELAFTMTEDIASGGQRLAIAFDLMIATAHSLSGVGLARGGLSFRSHAEAFLHGFPEGQGLREAWDRHYRRSAATLVGRVRAVAADLDGTTSAVPYVRDWLDVLRPYRDRASQLISSGLLTEQAPPVGADVDIVDLTQVSPFHQELFATSAWQEQTEATEWFLSYKLVLNYTYLHLTRLGVNPVERFLLCHLAACAVEQAHGMSAVDLIRTLADPPTIGAEAAR
ncbi:Lantibiotic biosynthesis dehydratase C-term [Micromonospora citrea]|uniref:Lantibiotic biosynthesis dehydratase C-term n=1 Tax=Micromonospora citrea TaxID=47855 RepID=A0A1C6TSR6_9ACTN|nr:thiopeptide maturation pyridine synthase [Micromonospora citrea]SCL44845.1 Lantibiotic biosynthesis dehydratase C-term [Micromonospora citrea]